MSHGHSALKNKPIQGRPDLEFRAYVEWSGMHWGVARRPLSGCWQRWPVPSDYGQSLCPVDTTGLNSVSEPIGDEAVDSERELGENCRSGSHPHTGGIQDSVPPEGLHSWGKNFCSEIQEKMRAVSDLFWPVLVLPLGTPFHMFLLTNVGT